MKSEEAYEALEGDVISLVYNSDYQYQVTFDDTASSSKPKRLSEEKILNDSIKRIKSENDEWTSIENGNCLIFTSQGVEGRNKIAAYDMDNTLIKTVSGNIFPKNIDDWQLNYQSIPKKLKALHENGFKIVVCTNQGGIEKGSVTTANIKKKIVMIQQRLEVPAQFFIATGYTKFRKPRIGMWEALEHQMNDGVSVDRYESFFVGDAAGRPEVKLTKRKKDHSCADRLFALNLGLSFYTPEEHFLNARDTPKNWNRPPFDPRTVSSSISLLEPSDAKLQSDSVEIVLMVGFPGSGKSFVSHEYLKKAGYVIINQDTLKSLQKCIAAAEASVKDKKSCVIDSTNPGPSTRQKFIEIAKKCKIPIRCFHFTTSYDQAKHNNIFRELTDRTHQKISEMVFHVYKKNYSEPSRKEGFSEIVKVNFVPKFKTPEEEKLYKLYLVEK